jgi:hypothetical protein
MRSASSGTSRTVAPPGQDGGALGVEHLRQFAGEARLPDPGFTGQQGDADVAEVRFLGQLLQPGQGFLPTDENPTHVSQEDRQGYRGGGDGLPADLTRRHRFGKAFQLHRSEVGDPDSRPGTARQPNQ